MSKNIHVYGEILYGIILVLVVPSKEMGEGLPDKG
jgi:hypothetical protein